MRTPPPFRPAALALLLALPGPAPAQDAVPAGACLLPSGQWCWSVQPTLYGQPCLCPTPNGQAAGVTQ